MKLRVWMSFFIFGILSGCTTYEMDKLDTSKQDSSLLTPPCLEKK